MVASASGPNFDPITGLPIQGTNASRNITPGSKSPEPLASDSLGTVPAVSNSPAPPPQTITPTTPPPLPILEQIMARIDALELFGERFKLSRDARRSLLEDLDERHPLV